MLCPVPPVKRYSLVDRPISPQSTSAPTVVIEFPSIDDVNGGGPSPPQTPPMQEDAHGVTSSLAALKNRDVLDVLVQQDFGFGAHHSQLAELSPDGRLVTLDAWRTCCAQRGRRARRDADAREYGQKASCTPSPAGTEPAPPIPPLQFPVDMLRAPSLMHTPSERSRVAETVETPESPRFLCSSESAESPTGIWGRRSRLCVCFLWTSSLVQS